jgi:hypothetical protein
MLATSGPLGLQIPLHSIPETLHTQGISNVLKLYI